jgi:uncharacterized protein
MTSLSTPPPTLRTCWRRLDVPGREGALLERGVDGWSLRGELDLQEDGSRAQLTYAIECDAAFLTRSARIAGTMNGVPVRFEVEADAAREWTCNGIRVPMLSGTLDIDLGFTPATNFLPIRRLDLTIGASAPVRSAWLRFPELVLEPLDQTYAREAERVFRYRATVDGAPFTARLDTDEFGRVVRYEDLWEIEPLPDELNAASAGQTESR